MLRFIIIVLILASLSRRRHFFGFPFTMGGHHGMGGPFGMGSPHGMGGGFRGGPHGRF